MDSPFSPSVRYRECVNTPYSPLIGFSPADWQFERVRLSKENRRLSENQRQPTIAKSPELRTKARHRLSANAVLSSAQREEQYMNSIPNFRARPVDRRILLPVLPKAPRVAEPGTSWKPLPLNRRILQKPAIVPRPLKFRSPNNPSTPPRGSISLEFFTPLGN